MKFRTFSLLNSTVSKISPKICVVGSGPAGFYAAQYMANRLETAQIDIIERLPVPFGLVRFGVAPDHANLKRCVNTFSKTAQLKNVRFMGNITLGKDVTLKQLKEAYHVVLLTYGVDDSRKLDLKGSNLKNIFQAKDFVGWYNGVPWNKDLPVDLSDTTASIFGHGNVAIDIARLLLSPIDKLKSTDITEHSLATFAQSRIKQVHLIGRRGPLQVSFTTKELRELLNLPNCCPIWRPEDMQNVPEIVPKLVKPRKRLTELMVDKFQNRQTPKLDDKQLAMIFHRSPKEFTGSEKVESIKLQINRLEGDDLLDKKAVPTQQDETIATSLVVASIGYKSVQADGDIPFNSQLGVVENQYGKVGKGLYTAGWVAKGASGVLLHTMEHAFGVASVILKDLELEGLGQEKPGFDFVRKVLDERNVQVVTWEDWLKIDEFERNEGKKLNKPREKVVDIEQMLKIAAT
ncbi:NADPH:adrenodoxin oxidoreductase, mitochondrial [Tribolium castaneum]|nr:PREDICTED: NADPH:adrenodoxin oxidoreductase, mitochondrial [Tribolium castaneum]|eukprot:XP_970322.1 PREDICTED: NADPH:adrenodoxin oxidoreductase, mitochondrial [Tribolium castaneum]